MEVVICVRHVYSRLQHFYVQCDRSLLR